MRSSSSAKRLIIATLSAVVLVALVLANVEAQEKPHETAQEVLDEFVEVKMDAEWNNQISQLLSSNEVERASKMVSVRVAYEIAEIKLLEPDLAAAELAEAKEVYRSAYPTLKRAREQKFLENIPAKWGQGLKLYFAEMESLGRKDSAPPP